ncbi:hypothetical protein XarbCFBP8132_10080 [Xanthomonas arboricola]|nr:hypothetical protein XarbCFBP8132_10080 [Xanthomonas arboricola]
MHLPCGKSESTRIEFQRGFARTLAPTPAPRPGPRWRRGRFKARAPMARKPRLLAPAAGGAIAVSPGSAITDRIWIF